MHEAQEGSAVELLRASGPWWPWISRFFWAPAHDLHPSRRATLLPGWSDTAWTEPGALRHISRHLLTSTSIHLGTELPLDSGNAALRLALLPQAPLALLARRLGLVLGDHSLAGELADVDRAFVNERAPLYWRGRALAGAPPCELVGWNALKIGLEAEPEAVRLRFGWKTPLPSAASAVGIDIDSSALQALALRILREFKEPWSSLFATSQH